MLIYGSIYNLLPHLVIPILTVYLLATNHEQQWCQERDLVGIREGELPLVNRDDKQELDKSPPSILYLFIQEIY